MKVGTLIFYSIVVIGLLCVASLQQASAQNKFTEDKVYNAYLQPVNDTTTTGTARLRLRGNMLLINLRVFNMEPNAIHIQHMQGFDDGKNARCAPQNQDKDQTGFTEVYESESFTGGPLLPITPFPYLKTPHLSFQGLYTLTEKEVLSLEKNVIQLYGMTRNGVYDPILPIACGEIRPRLY